MSRAGDVRCVGCALVDNMRAGAELNRLTAPYNTTGTIDTVIAVNTRAMQPAAGLSSSGSSRRRLATEAASMVLPASNFPHRQRDDPDSGNTFGWCASRPASGLLRRFWMAFDKYNDT
jgi:hypothetical protein